MSIGITINNFEEIYHKTYKNTLKYVVIHCNNLEDVNDIIQDTYVELYKNIKRHKSLDLEAEEGFIIGICKNILKKYYRLKYNNKVIPIETQEISSYEDIELNFITKENVSLIWDYVKNKNIIIAKIFYLYYCLDMKILDISKEMNLTESATKNYIYRTIKELKEIYAKESDRNAGK